MSNLSEAGRRFLLIACYFEASLALVALLLGWLFDINPFAELFFSENALICGVIATLPLLVLFFAIQQLPYQALQDIRRLLQQTLGQPLRFAHWTDLLALASLAGLGEEVLFRGLLQQGFEHLWGADLALIGSGLIFALAHAVTALYALLALLMSLYLGLAMDLGGERNLLTPIVIHALYDFVAFLVIVRQSALHTGNQDETN